MEALAQGVWQWDLSALETSSQKGAVVSLLASHLTKLGKDVVKICIFNIFDSLY